MDPFTVATLAQGFMWAVKLTIMGIELYQMF